MTETAPPVDPEKQAAIDKAVAEARKAEADARAAVAAAQKAEAEADALEDPLARQLKEAQNKQALAEAEQKTAAAKQLQMKAFVPDLSTVKESTLEVAKEGPAIGGGMMTFGALDRAAESIAAHIARLNPKEWRVLVTSDEDLATPDAIYSEVKNGLDQLEEAATILLKEIAPEETVFKALDAVTLLPALMSAVPQVLSLLSAQRSVRTGKIDMTDLDAAAAVAGALESTPNLEISVTHDSFRLVPENRVQEVCTRVSGKRQELISRKIQITEAQTARAGAEVDQEPKSDPVPAMQLTLIESLVGAIDAFMAAIRVVPEGKRRSPLATAMLMDALHAEATNKFTHVLLVKAHPAQFSQMTDNRPLWKDDRFSTMVEVNVTFMLIDTTDSTIVRAGTASATAMAFGKIGEKFLIDNSTVFLTSLPDSRGG